MGKVTRNQRKLELSLIWNNRKKEKMNRIIPFTIILMVLAACTALPTPTPPPTATSRPQTSLPNPASLYCQQNGNQLEIRTAADGSQSGVCLFPDGSTCDEWAYFKAECGPAAQKSPTLATTGEAATPDANGGGPGGSTNSGGNASGGYMAPGTTEAFTDWWGVITSTPPGAEYDDYFERQDLGQTILFGIMSMDPVVQAQIVALRDSGKIVHLSGTLLSHVPDYNGSQLQVDRIEMEG
jgi:putative hemolysin